MAAALLASALPGKLVGSAGLGALVGEPADPTAVALIRDRGLDIGDHRAVQINRVMCLQAELVLVMEQGQQSRLQELYPEIFGRVFRIAEYAKLDVPDPYRRSLETFRTALDIIEQGVAFWVQRIQRL